MIRWLLPLLLAGCCTLPDAPPAEVIEIEREVLVELPAELTAPLPVPEWPARRLSNEDCVDDVLELEQVIAQCQEDRGRIRDLERRARQRRDG